MEKKKKFFSNIWVRIILVFVLIIGGFSIRLFLEDVYVRMRGSEKEESGDTYNTGGAGRTLEYAENIPEDDPMIQAFKAYMPDYKILISGKCDITSDGLEDMVIIYRDGVLAYLVTGIDSGDGVTYDFSDPVLAPRENQRLRFFNMDKEGEMEFVVQGEKNGKTGYGIFRVIDGVPTNLFAEGMEEC